MLTTITLQGVMGQVELSTKQADKGDRPYSSSSIAPSKLSLVVLSQDGVDDTLLPRKFNEGPNVAITNNNEQQILTGTRETRTYLLYHFT